MNPDDKVLIITPEDWEALKAQLGAGPGEIAPGSAMKVILSRFAPPGGALVPALVTKPFDFQRDLWGGMFDGKIPLWICRQYKGGLARAKDDESIWL